MNYLFIVGALIVLAGLAASFVLASKQQHRQRDDSMAAATYRHRFFLNPGIWAYLSIAVAAVLVIGYFAYRHY
ncbi:hypothetical protein B5M42_013930 [Paenibacillus athensensis]|uniref:Uncharacterized protein n=1 Tax=Paenibacillus athensensis TaxID=1967502 RepID=A0A4Y8PXS4_9BACL|nr:hypothetical protein [Paenibacillus athensensis]MCD1259931.1 hypothetical protein [Paenibacillus athensensis]